MQIARKTDSANQGVTMRKFIYFAFICAGFFASQFGFGKAEASVPIVDKAIQNEVTANEPSVLYFSDALEQNGSGLVAAHYSHQSHGSHQSHRSHYSSRY